MLTRINALALSAALAALFLLGGCTTFTGSNFNLGTAEAVEAGTVAGSAYFILHNNPSDVAAASQLANSIGTSGAVTPAQVDAALAAIPQISAKVQSDLKGITVALTAALTSYSLALPAGTAVAPGDSTAAALVNTFASALNQAIAALPPSPPN